MRLRSIIISAMAAVLSAGLNSAASAAERLVLLPYPGPPSWVEVTNKSDGTQSLREMIPADQKIDAYRDILSAQSFTNLKGTAPDAYLKSLFPRFGHDCTGVRVNGPKTATEDGLTVAYAQVFCGRQNGQTFGVNMFLKAIQGQDALYVINREMRVPPSATGGVQSFSKDQLDGLRALMQAQSNAAQYLDKSVFVCADQSTADRCKAP